MPETKVAIMDVVYLIMIGAGVLCMAVALFLKGNRTDDADRTLLTQRTTDRTEIEKLVQGLERKWRQEKEWVRARLEATEGELRSEMHELRQRVAQWENARPLNQEEPLPQTMHQEKKEGIEAPAEVDMLALRERYRRAFELHREGLSADEIAKRLGAGRGEIDLIFALASRNERGAYDA